MKLKYRTTTFDSREVLGIYFEINKNLPQLKFSLQIELLSIQMHNERIEITLYNSLKVGYTMMIDVRMNVCNREPIRCFLTLLILLADGFIYD